MVSYQSPVQGGQRSQVVSTSGHPLGKANGNSEAEALAQRKHPTHLVLCNRRATNPYLSNKSVQLGLVRSGAVQIALDWFYVGILGSESFIATYVRNIHGEPDRETPWLFWALCKSVCSTDLLWVKITRKYIEHPVERTYSRSTLLVHWDCWLYSKYIWTPLRGELIIFLSSSLTLSLLSLKVYSPNLLKRKCISEVARIGSIIIFHLSKLWKAKFSILFDVIFLLRLQGKFDIDQSKSW